MLTDPVRPAQNQTKKACYAASLFCLSILKDSGNQNRIDHMNNTLVPWISVAITSELPLMVTVPVGKKLISPFRVATKENRDIKFNNDFELTIVSFIFKIAKI